MGTSHTFSDYRSIAHLFGLAWCTVCQIAHKNCKAIIQKFKSVYINFPTGDNLTDVIQVFHSKWNVPQCAGSFDGTHIPITLLTLITITVKDGIPS